MGVPPQHHRADALLQVRLADRAAPGLPLVTCGFSAGGHLAGSLGVHWRKLELPCPDAQVLCYPVVTAGPWAHRPSIEHLTAGDPAFFSLEKHVTRDTPQVLSQNFPVFCSGCWAQDSSIRTYVFDFRCTIEIGQVTIHDGDLVFGDVDGVLIIPRQIADEVLEKALEKAAGEKTVRKAIEGGMSATAAFAEYGIL